MRPQLSKAIAELVGTFAIIFSGCGAIMIAERFPGSVSHSAIPAVFGLVVAAIIYATGHISGAHFNPAVTAAFAIARHFPPRQVLIYWTAQFAGALLAMGLLWLLLPTGQLFGATIPVIAPLKALLWEAVLSFFLMFVIIAVATDTRAEGTMAGAAIGATVMFCSFFGGPVTGASMNPARSLAPNLFQGECNTLWIYLVGPFAGTITAALLYEAIRCGPADKDSKGCC
ncbi:MAG: aquaporin [Deltaproteobacteria bacterium]|nr:aquaporin [Deltaproteobacteria bacterium]